MSPSSPNFECERFIWPNCATGIWTPILIGVSYGKEIVCPLNGKDNITETCVKYRKCFDGEAVKYERGVSRLKN